MGTGADLLHEIDQWEAESLITAEQAATLRERVIREDESTPSRQVVATEILVYLGSVIVALALAFLAILNWQELGSSGRILVVLLPALAMFALGWPLRSAADPRLQRGAQALWLGASLIAGVVFLVIFHELRLIDWRERGPTDLYFLLSCLLAGALSVVAYTLLATVAQSLPFHFWLSLGFISFLGWLDIEFPPFNPWRTLLLGLVMGGLWLALAAWLNRRRYDRLAAVSLLVGAVTALATPFLLAPWEETPMEVVSLVANLLFIGASVRYQSRILLYGGAVFLLLLITYLNFERFAGEIGMPIALFLSGTALILLGLGTGWLNRLINRRVAAG